MKNKISLGWFHCLLPAAILMVGAGLAGCAGYQLGSTLPKNLKTVYVPAFVNKTEEPLAETEATKATLQELQKDGTLRVTTQEACDTILEVTLVDIKFTPLSYQANSQKTANEYRMYVTASIIFKKSKTNELLTKKTVTGETTFLPAGDLASAKRLALPYASKDLAHRIVEAVTEYW